MTGGAECPVGREPAGATAAKKSPDAVVPRADAVVTAAEALDGIGFLRAQRLASAQADHTGGDVLVARSDPQFDSYFAAAEGSADRAPLCQRHLVEPLRLLSAGGHQIQPTPVAEVDRA